MTDLNELLNRIDARADRALDQGNAHLAFAVCAGVPRLTAALRSVLELHAESHGGGCSTCWEAFHDEPTQWPCLTVRTLNDVLGNTDD